MLAGDATWQPACPAHPCLQPRRLRGCKLGKGSSMRTAICTLGTVPRPLRGIVLPPSPGQAPSPAHEQSCLSTGSTSPRNSGMGLQEGEQEVHQSHLQQPATVVTSQPPGGVQDPLRVRDGPSVTGMASFHATPAFLIFKAAPVDDKLPSKLISLRTSSPDDTDPSSLIVVPSPE